MLRTLFPSVVAFVFDPDDCDTTTMALTSACARARSHPCTHTRACAHACTHVHVLCGQGQGRPFDHMEQDLTGGLSIVRRGSFFWPRRASAGSTWCTRTCTRLRATSPATTTLAASLSSLFPSMSRRIEPPPCGCCPMSGMKDRLGDQRGEGGVNESR
jgi:hypothetical protein